MFMGEYQHSIDKKGRLTIPARFREILGEKFIITRGLDRCLFVYSLVEWSLLEKKFKSLSFTKQDARTFMRLFFSGAAECELDKQGRILIPNNLRKYAQIQHEAVVIGVSTRVEVWNSAIWEEYSSEANLSYEQIAERMVDPDF